jgi:ubiquinone/menaquinone biosynthesis C-methylase UbiE
MANETERRRWNDEQTVANWPKRERFTDRVVPHVVAALKPAPGDKVLDIGSGGGKLSLAIAQLVQPGGKVVGADISSGMVRMATERAAEA